MSLRDELARLTGRRAAADRPAPAPPPCAPLPGEEVRSPAGSFHRVITRFPAEHRHGRVPLACLLREGAPRALCTRDERLVGLDPARTILLDTETTGLAGGSGTYAFLVGVAFFRERALEVHQLLMRDYAEEPAMLQELAGLLSGRDFLVTYNGKCFDLPLLEARFILARMDVDVQRHAHLDLLFPARRLWRGRAEDCRLATLERTVCGFERAGDVDGSEIPGIYFDYLARRDPARLSRVIDHNRWDLLSLAALLARVLGLVRDPRSDAEIGPEDLVRVAKLYVDAGDRRAARPLLEEAARATGPARRTALARLAEVCRRLGDEDAAAAAWEACLAEPGAFDPEPYERLARHCLRRPGRAPEAVRWLSAAAARADDLAVRARLIQALRRAEARAARPPRP